MNDCFKKRDNNARGNGSSNGNSKTNGKGKTNAKTSNSHLFADQERARILEYVNRTFSLYAESGEEAASKVSKKDF